jgi:hypothetical protein
MIGYGVSSIAFNSLSDVFVCSTNPFDIPFPIYNFTSTNVLTTTPFSLPVGGDFNTFWSTAVVKWDANGSADSWTQMQDDFPGGYRSIVVDSKDNLYLADGAYYLPHPVPKPINNFSTTSTPGTTVFTATAGGMIVVKWDSLGIATAWSQTSNDSVYSYPFYAVVDVYDNVYIGLNLVPDVDTAVFSDLSTTNTMNSRVTSVNSVSFIVKYLNTGVFDLGTVTTDINFTIPNGGAGQVLTKQVLLVTTNYRYKFDLGSSSVQVDGTFGNLGQDLIFVWTGSSWILVPS